MRFKDKNLHVIVTKYFKYLKKRSKLILEKGHRSRRQIVEKQIKRLEKKLSRIPNALQKGAIAATLVGATLLGPQIMDAQITFGSIQSNPFSLTHIQAGYYGTNFPNSSFADLDNDGDLDMISGSIYFSEFYYFENVGTVAAPDFSAWVSNPFSIVTQNGGAFQPSFVDLDNDGDFDIMSGRSATQMTDGDFYYFENIGTPSSPNYTTAQINPFSIIAEEGTSSPVFADLDGDGDFDMTTISTSKGFDYFENTGSASAPNFAPRQHNPFSLTPTTATGNFHGFGDIDNDGDLDLISAENFTSFKYFENIGSSTSPSFGPIQSNPWGPMVSPWRGSATFVDIDNDGDLDLMSGDMSVGFRYFENTTAENTDIQSPTIPTNLTASNVTETSADLAWNISSDNVAVVGYNVYQDDVLISTVPSNNTTISGLPAGSTYLFHVTAIDAAGNQSAASNEVSVTISDIESPTIPTNLTVSTSNVTEIIVSLAWNASSDNVAVVGYNVYKDSVFRQSTASLSVTLFGLSEGTTFNFTVRAFDAAGNESASSSSVSITTGSTVVVHEGYFETGWDNWVDGGSDCARYSGSFSSEGNHSIQLRDNSNVSSSMTSPAIDLSSFDQVTVDFSYYPRSMENNEDFWLRYFDGNSWQTIATFTRNVDFVNNVFYTVNTSISSNEYNFSADSKFRFQCDASGNNDKIYIDAVIITGDSNGGSNNAYVMNEIIIDQYANKISGDFESSNTYELENYEDDIFEVEKEFIVYPNPTSNIIYINGTWNGESNEEIQLINIYGQMLLKKTINNRFDEVIKLDVAHLPAGIYMINIIQSKELLSSQKIMITNN